MSRSLAHIEKIINIEPIPDADFIERVGLLGWSTVAKKGDFKLNELCIYFECDSIVPDMHIFEFMRDRKFRVKTQKFRGQIAQGLALPISNLKFFSKKNNWKEGDDVTNIIGVKKYDPYIEKEIKTQQNNKKRNPIDEYLMSFNYYRHIKHLFGFKRVRNWPTFIQKTDENRIQNIPQIFKQWDNKDCYITEKLDGSSASFAYKNKRFYNFLKPNFYVCSRNICLYKENSSEWWEIARKFDIKNKLKSIGINIAIQGEIVGPKVCGNTLELPELDFYVFNIFDIDKGKRYNIVQKIDFCESLEFKMVPFLNSITITKNHTVNDIIGRSYGKSVLNPKKLREGIVIRQQENDAMSFKCISPEWAYQNQKMLDKLNEQ